MYRNSLLTFFLLIILYTINKKIFFQNPNHIRSHKINFFLKKTYFLFLRRQTQLFLLMMISHPFFNELSTLTPHFKAYITHMDIQNHKWDHTILKKQLELVKPALQRFAATKYGPKHAFLSIFAPFSQIIIIFTPQVLYIFGKVWQ